MRLYMNQISYNDWCSKRHLREFELVLKYQYQYEDYPLNTERIRTAKTAIYKVNTEDSRGCSHVLSPRFDSIEYCQWLTDAEVEKYKQHTI